MPEASDTQPLGRQHVAVMLRLVLDPSGDLVYGEVVDLAGATHGRFATWMQLETRLQAWIALGVAPRTLK